MSSIREDIEKIVTPYMADASCGTTYNWSDSRSLEEQLSEELEAYINKVKEEAVVGFVKFLSDNFPLEDHKVILDITVLNKLKDMYLIAQNLKENK